MGVPMRHVFHQSKVLGALGRTAVLALRQRGGNGAVSAPTTPGPEVQRRVPPLPRALIDDYVHFLGGDPRAYRGQVPPHLFPQWCVPSLARTLEGLPYPLLRVLNGGCRVRVTAPIAGGEPLQVRARLQDVDDDGRRAVLHQRVITGAASAPDALEIDLYAIVPLRRDGDREGTGGNGKSGGDGPTRERKEPARVPVAAHEVSRIRLSRDAGLSFAKLTGDFNPIHWLVPYARAAGFPNVILHGFGTFAFAWEGLNRSVFGGDVRAIETFDAKFARPLALPHEIGLFVQERQMFVGDAPGGPAYLTGTFLASGDRPSRPPRTR